MNQIISYYNWMCHVYSNIINFSDEEDVETDGESETKVSQHCAHIHIVSQVLCFPRVCGKLVWLARLRLVNAVTHADDHNVQIF